MTISNLNFGINIIFIFIIFLTTLLKKSLLKLFFLLIIPYLFFLIKNIIKIKNSKLI